MSAAPGIETDDLIVLLMGAPSRHSQLRDKVSGVTRLEKLIFLMHERDALQPHLKETPHFVADKFGPFSLDVYKAVETLEAAGLLREQSREASTSDDLWESDELIGLSEGPAYTERHFELTELGKKYFGVLKTIVPKATLDDVAALKDRFGSLPLRQLIRYVYTEVASDPERQHLLDRSTIRKDVLGS